MATKHWVRDVPLTDPQNYIANGNHIQANAVLYNFLKVAGWEQIWECDGELGSAAQDPNHVLDGNVQSAGTTYWTQYNGATVTKDTTKVYSGQRSLKVVASAATQGVITDPLTSMRTGGNRSTDTGDYLSGPVGREMTFYDDSTWFDENRVGDYLEFSGNTDPNNDGVFTITKYIDANTVKFENPLGSPTSYYSGTPPPAVNVCSVRHSPRYEITIVAATDVAFDVEVDRGDGSYSTVGTIPANGSVFTRYDFNFRVLGALGITIRFKSAAAGTLYIGGIHVFSSVWDRLNVIERGTDGILTNPDQFSTAGSFTPDASDVGKILFVWDPTNNKNSGAYPILSVAAGVATLDLRSGSAALTTASGLRWRIVLIDYLTYPNSGITDSLAWSGFAFESIHASKWRFFLRQSQASGQTGKGSILWSAPLDTDFDFSSGEFYKTGPSTQRNRQIGWVKIPDSAAATGEHLWRGGYSYKTSPHDSRMFLMTDEDGAFIAFFCWDEDGDHGCHLHGYLASDLPGIESHFLFSRWEDRGVANECYFDNSGNRFAQNGTTYGDNELTVPCCVAQLGIGSGANDSVALQSNSGLNPWSGNEWKRPLILWRDLFTNKQQMALQIADCGVYQGRQNLPELSTIASDTLLHLDNGYIWEWSGETLV